MTILRSIVLCCLLVSAAFGQTPSFEQPLVNAGGTQSNEVMAVARDAGGATYLVGKHTDTLRLGGVTIPPGAGGAWVAKVNGSVAWVRQGGTPSGSDAAYGVAVDALGNVYVCGALFSPQIASFSGNSLGSNYNGFVAKYDQAGALLWVQGYGAAVYAITLDRSDVPIINLGDSEIHLLNVNNGTLSTETGTLSGANQNPWYHTICVDDSNNIIAQGGNKVVKFRHDLTTVWSTAVSGSLIETFRINLDAAGDVYGTFYGLFGTVTVGGVAKTSFPNGYLFRLNGGTGAVVFCDSILIGGFASKIREVIPADGDYYVVGDGAFSTPVALRMTPAYANVWQVNLDSKTPVSDMAYLGTDCVLLGGKHTANTSLGGYPLNFPNGATGINNSYAVKLCMTTGVADEPAITPRSFAVAPNYPNPFNPSTTIRIELPRAAQVSVSVHDLLGRRVATLLDERREAGVHQVVFDAGDLAGGVYTYVVNAGGERRSGRMLLVR